jgi:hypothetical protein
MTRQKFDPERDLRAWADALNAVADLQHAIVEESEHMTMLDDWQWLDPFRAIVFGALKTFPDKVKENNYLHLFEAATGLKSTAIEALAQLREEAKEHRKKESNTNAAN